MQKKKIDKTLEKTIENTRKKIMDLFFMKHREFLETTAYLSRLSSFLVSFLLSLVLQKNKDRLLSKR